MCAQVMVASDYSDETVTEEDTGRTLCECTCGHQKMFRQMPRRVDMKKWWRTVSQICVDPSTKVSYLKGKITLESCQCAADAIRVETETARVLNQNEVVPIVRNG